MYKSVQYYSRANIYIYTYIIIVYKLYINYIYIYIHSLALKSWSVDRHGPNPGSQANGGHKITVLIWPACFSKGLSAIDVKKVIRKKLERAVFVLKIY